MDRAMSTEYLRVRVEVTVRRSWTRHGHKITYGHMDTRLSALPTANGRSKCQHVGRQYAYVRRCYIRMNFPITWYWLADYLAGLDSLRLVG